MCGIVGYIGNRQAQPILLNALTKLEYRGYDSCGIGLQSGGIKVYKDAIRVEELSHKIPVTSSTLGIGHTRWATHGEPAQINAHPHMDCHGKFAVVHNGVINNYLALKASLIAEGHTFTSETDSEVIVHLIEKYYHGNLEQAVEATLNDIKGSYAIVVIAANEAKIVVAKKESPLVVGIGNNEYIVASDIPAILEHTNRIIYLEDGDIGIVTRDYLQVLNNGKTVDREEKTIQWTLADVAKSGYDHFMLKEIHEQPTVIRRILEGYSQSPESGSFSHLVIEGLIHDLVLVACGTSFHAALIGKYLIEELAGIPVKVELASEYNHSRRAIPSSAGILITQSGETADVLMSMRKMKQLGMKTLALTNVPGSTASRLADWTEYLYAGPEISVAATKSFLAQLIMLYQLVLSLPQVNPEIARRMASDLRHLPYEVQLILDREDKILQHAKFIAGFNNVFFIARGISYPIALEGALKLKEISYIHAEGYQAGELKHGSFALLDSNTPIVAIVAHDDTYQTMLTNLKEVKTRKAPVLALVDEADEIVEQIADSVIKVPHVIHSFSPVVNTVTLQLLAYYVAKERGCPIDYPRNLAKSVTVE